MTQVHEKAHALPIKSFMSLKRKQDRKFESGWQWLVLAATYNQGHRKLISCFQYNGWADSHGENADDLVNEKC